MDVISVRGQTQHVESLPCSQCKQESLNLTPKEPKVCFIMFSSWTCWHELLIPLLVRQSWTEAGVLMADQLVHLEPEVPERTWWKALKEGHPRVFPGSFMHTHKRVFSHHKTSYIVSGFQLQNKKHAYSPSGQAGASLRFYCQPSL